jgi:hypothetical protein
MKMEYIDTIDRKSSTDTEVKGGLKCYIVVPYVRGNYTAFYILNILAAHDKSM